MSDDIRDERLSRLYREAEAAAPPEALDRAILAASRAALAPARRRAPDGRRGRCRWASPRRWS